MRFLVEVSGEHPTLPLGELAAALANIGLPVDVERAADRVFIVEVTPPDLAPSDEDHESRVVGALSKLAMTHRASRYLFSAPRSPDALRVEAASVDLGDVASFAVRCERVPTDEYVAPELVAEGVDGAFGTSAVARCLGSAWSDRTRVDLDAPEVVVRALVAGPVVHVGRALWENDGGAMEGRAVRNRPFFSPVSGPPRLMRACVNLARPPKGGIVYDPLCGTGGVLIEAALMGYLAVGSDIDEQMVDGTRENMRAFGALPHSMFMADVRDAPRRYRRESGTPHPDAIVTDLPYGQSASTGDASPADVAALTFEAIEALLPPGRLAVVGLGDAAFVPKTLEALEVLDTYEVRAHKSRTRTYLVCKHL